MSLTHQRSFCTHIQMGLAPRRIAKIPNLYTLEEKGSFRDLVRAYLTYFETKDILSIAPPMLDALVRPPRSQCYILNP